MNRIKRYALAIGFTAAIALPGVAQDQSSSSAVMRKRDRNEKNEGHKPGVTQRMETFYQESETPESDLQWMRVIYRQLDLQKEANAPLYFPEEPTEGEESLFRMILRLLANNQVEAYEYLDGREVFTEQYRIKVKDMLDRFHILYTDAKGSTEKNPKFTIEESDVPANEVLSYYILERWEFDSRHNRTVTKVQAICPVLHRAGDFGGEPIKYPMFWIKLEALRPYLSQQPIFISDDNNLAKYTYDDYFQLNMYDGEIYKTRNLANKSMMQMYPDPDDMKRAQDSIQNRLENFDKKLWVPSREEVIAEREKKEAEEQQKEESIVITSRDEEPAVDDKATEVGSQDEQNADEKKAKTNSRSKKKPKKSKVKQTKPKQSSSGAVRSVRRKK
ncbi:MAG: gliding motility protein GldN [Muribaculaceae bacterium]